MRWGTAIIQRPSGGLVIQFIVIAFRPAARTVNAARGV